MKSPTPAQVLGGQIEALRKRLGSLTRPLSYGDLAAELSKRLKRTPPIASSTVMKWEQASGGHPDPWALVELARLAQVSAEDFVYPPAAVDVSGDSMRSLGERERMPEPKKGKTRGAAG